MAKKKDIKNEIAIRLEALGIPKTGKLTRAMYVYFTSLDSNNNKNTLHSIVNPDGTSVPTPLGSPARPISDRDPQATAVYKEEIIADWLTLTIEKYDSDYEYRALLDLKGLTIGALDFKASYKELKIEFDFTAVRASICIYPEGKDLLWAAEGCIRSITDFWEWECKAKTGIIATEVSK